MGLPKTPAKIEWEAWQELVSELNKLGVDINSENNLAESIRYWGWKFHELDLPL